MLGFWLWGLKWAGQDGEFDIFQDLFRRINEINLSNGSYYDRNLKVALCQKILKGFYIARINIPNHYPEQKV